MILRQIIAKWQGSTLTGWQSYQAHFADLCALVGAATPTPATADTYCYERGVAKTGSKHGWADVWKRGCFGFEHKVPDRNFDVALKQLMTYALALDNPATLASVELGSFCEILVAIKQAAFRNQMHNTL